MFGNLSLRYLFKTNVMVFRHLELVLGMAVLELALEHCDVLYMVPVV